MNAVEPRDAWVVFYRRVFGLVAAAVIGWLVWRILEPFVGPLVWGVFLAFLLQPAQRRLAAGFGDRPSLAAFVVVLFTLVLLAGPMTLLGGMFAAQARTLVDAVQAWTDRLQISSVQDLENLPILQRAFAWIENNVAVTADQLREWVATGAQRALEPLASMGGQLFLGALGTLGSFTVMLFVLFFLLRDGPRMAAAALRLVPLPADRKQRLRHHMESVTRAVVFGTIATAILQGTLVGIGFAIAGLPSPVVFGVAAAVLSVVPFGGTALVWGPGALWLIFGAGEIGWGIFLLVWGAGIVGLADNVVKPMLISGRAEVPTLAVFLGVLGGLGAFGFVGLFVGPIVIALAIALLRFADETIGQGPLPEASARVTEAASVPDRLRPPDDRGAA
jgi:predicted PurR-regulated permease PerM